MRGESLDQLEALLFVAQEGSFTRAAAKLGISQSALSQTVRDLESRMGVRLLARTTRSVTPTDAGERLLQSVSPRIEEIRQELEALQVFRDRPSGQIRINADEHAAQAVLWPVVAAFLRRYPDIRIEIAVDYGLTDIVAGRYDAGVRLGEIVARDMIALPIGPAQRMVVVASPTYLSEQPAPRTPQDLTAHRCINLRLPTQGGLYAWEFAKGRRQVNVRVDGQLVCNTMAMMLKGALAGFGLAYLPIGEVRALLDDGRLTTVLEDWCPSYPGYRLYYPSRRLQSPAFVLLLDALRDAQSAR
jgi:DNA-binding transcriptional LysR family regulator